ncbi:hypothetical protein KCP71_19205 [Salmonella enterica subsp. enterica]|nr:hypothetical protein KCP71_19205 [Salmonella enterica subsp. enterica]
MAFCSTTPTGLKRPVPNETNLYERQGACVSLNPHDPAVIEEGANRASRKTSPTPPSGRR